MKLKEPMMGILITFGHIVLHAAMFSASLGIETDPVIDYEGITQKTAFFNK
jgi:hypothetical protein